jgi:hypothetical protein
MTDFALKKTTNNDEISSVLKHPDIWPRIADKDQSIDEWQPPHDDVSYLYSEGVVFILHPEGDAVEIHANVLPDYRHKAEAAANMALEYGFNTLQANEIIAKIPKEYGSVYGFALKFMNDAGFAGKEHLLSLRREEWAL